MGRVTDFRTAELRIAADKFPLPARVEDLLRIYGGFGQWEGAPHAANSVALFELPVSRVAEIERALEEAGGMTSLKTLPTSTLYLFRRQAESLKEWKRAKSITDELVRRGEFGERKVA